MTSGRTDSTAAQHIDFLGLRFDAICMDKAVERIACLSQQRRFAYVVTPNVDHVVRLHDRSERDPFVWQAYDHADLTLCDSRILALLARWSGTDLEVVPGSDLTRHVLEAKGPWRRLAVVGGDGILHEMLRERYPSYEWRFHEPPMGVRRSRAARDAIAEFVSGADADIVFFAIGAPQSEMTCREIAQNTQSRGAALCIGASLEFLTGMKTRAPWWMQRAKLEWLHRLVSEPSRLWRRYLVEGPRIIAIWRQHRRDHASQ